MMELHKMQAQTEALEQQWLHLNSFIDFRYEAVEISINTTTGLLLIHISLKNV